jgi:hypothetical protein
VSIIPYKGVSSDSKRDVRPPMSELDCLLDLYIGSWQIRKKRMKTLISKVIDAMRPRAHWYQDQVLTDELERELMKAYAGTGFRGRHYRL